MLRLTIPKPCSERCVDARAPVFGQGEVADPERMVRSCVSRMNKAGKLLQELVRAHVSLLSSKAEDRPSHARTSVSRTRR